MKPIAGNFFLDTSVVIYLLDKTDLRKEEIAFNLLKQKGFVSPQVLFECINVCTKKLKYAKPAALAFTTSLFNASYLQVEDVEVVEKGFTLFSKYLLQPFDSKIIAAALAANCSVIYSEDMQNGLLIENRLTIINPFL